jgi:Rhodanese-like domain
MSFLKFRIQFLNLKLKFRILKLNCAIKNDFLHQLTAVLRKQAPYDNIDTCLVDCRYPYEYVAGHIRGFQNIFLPEDVRAHFLKKLNHQNVSACRRTILIFHCEFSSKRAPDL